ncbi:MAG: enoyl-CoA hydratase/isomerase family protein [Alphaproteobacteria bacterium]|jgi:methylglutaconyl-CoA hydratase|nr:enoyl-CoA hydratase/isomerase family protein [Alphaproteobacteria bacterium]MDP6517043.1 enoyl-CoA hydratase/isomerase family protein [Alphaproteobacteria bacterium]
MTEEPLLLDISAAGVARITLNRPEVHNAFDDHQIRRLAEAFVRLDGEDSVRAVVLAANGKSFSAGADLNWMKRTAAYSDQENRDDAHGLASLLAMIRGFAKPTVARVQGSAYGGGLGLVAACDIAIAAEEAKFMLSEVRLGLVPAVISPHVVAAMGERSARRYFITAERFDAAEARRIGLVHEVVAQDALDDAIEAILSHLAKGGPGAVAAAKDLVDAVANRPIDDEVVADTARRIAELRASAEGREGIAAFLEKRSPNWVRTS